MSGIMKSGLDAVPVFLPDELSIQLFQTDFFSLNFYQTLHSEMLHLLVPIFAQLSIKMFLFYYTNSLVNATFGSWKKSC